MSVRPRHRRKHARERPSSPPANGSFGPPAELVIEAVGGEGDGIAPGPVYVPYTLPGERVLAQGAGERRTLVEVLAQSPERVAPPCPHFGACGGCALQHWAAQPYEGGRRGQSSLGERGRLGHGYPPV